MYSRSTVSSDGKFPPTPSKTYVNLAVVRRSDEVRDLEELRKHTLHGRVDEILNGKREIEIGDILKPQDNGKPLSLVFVEGPPGIGKSTLAWELCRRWDRKQYDLAVLLRLRERKVQQIESIAKLFPHVDQDLQKSVAKDVLVREGKGVLFILDGYDELPNELRCESFLLELARGRVYPKCCVLITSRPSATKHLYVACLPQRHVEILGFTQESVSSYAASVFTKPEVLEDFLSYISTSENPAINSLMYIPLNAAIIVHVFKTSKRKGCPIPITLTQVYTQLCLTLLQRHLDNIDPLNAPTMNRFSSLHGKYRTDFNMLSQLAFEQFAQSRIVFYSDDIPQESVFVHFGLLDSVPPLHGGGGVSYNFLHLTVQEFLAAYHITQLSDGIADVFKRHSEDRRWEVVWRFVSGLTGFEFFKDNVQCGAFGVELTQILNDMPFGHMLAITTSEIFVIPMHDPSSDPCPIAVSNLFLHCLFEGQVTRFDYPSAFGRNAVFCQVMFSPLDMYVAGYCIANSSSTTSWIVDIVGGSDESFVWGLKSRHSDNGIIRHLVLGFVYPFLLPSYPVSMLRGIQSLTVIYHDYSHADEVAQSLIQVFPLLENLSSLSLDVEFNTSRVALDLLDVVSCSNVTTLILLISPGPTEDPKFLTSLHSLVNPSSSNLKNLTLDLLLIKRDLKAIFNIVFGQTSLNQLTLRIGFFCEESLNLLQADTSLTHVQYRGDLQCPFQAFSNILRKNRTIQVLRWFVDEGYYTIPPDHMEAFQEALSVNTTLKEFVVIMYRDNPRLDCSLLASNPRVTLSYV